MKAPQLQPLTQAQHLAEIDGRLGEALGSLAEAMYHAGAMGGPEGLAAANETARLFRIVSQCRERLDAYRDDWTPIGLTK